MLIYQPDAFIFKDDLSKWCSKGYEYIGAPNVGKARQNVYSPAMPMRVGNGGFSLRSIPAFMRFFDGQKPVFNLWHVLTSPLIRKPNYWWIVAKALKLRFTDNTPTEVLAHWQGNEDDFWGCLLALSEYALSRPVPEDALQFAFDRFPRELYNVQDTSLWGAMLGTNMSMKNFGNLSLTRHSFCVATYDKKLQRNLFLS